VTGLSLVAQYLQARRIVENWHFWILVDVICTFYLFPIQKLYVTTGLYGIFLILAVMGLLEWLKIWRRQSAEIDA
jgi:nicotinamide mononucleotide transporter